tara:strand:+ start:668 stop:1150 length:483 start_codon:yes stop_codon:yes gene_type:complete
MRKITKESSKAFVNFEQFKKDNTEVKITSSPKNLLHLYRPPYPDEIAKFYLHGNCIAEVTRKTLPECFGSKSTEIDLCGWHTPTTRERINGILDALGYDFRIAQRNHEQVLVLTYLHNYLSPKEKILKLSDDSFDPDFAKDVFNSKEFVNGTDLNAITDF